MTKINPIICGEIAEKLPQLVKTAGKSIDIIAYDWRWYPNQPLKPTQLFNQAVVQAVQDGIQVRAVCNRAEQALKLQAAGIKARSLEASKTVHSKVIIIDGEKLLVGSHNLTRNAFARNFETSLLVEDGPTTDRFKKYFHRLYERAK